MVMAKTINNLEYIVNQFEGNIHQYIPQ